MFENCAGEVPAHHTGQWGSSIPSLLLHHLVPQSLKTMLEVGHLGPCCLSLGR